MEPVILLQAILIPSFWLQIGQQASVFSEQTSSVTLFQRKLILSLFIRLLKMIGIPASQINYVAYFSFYVPLLGGSRKSNFHHQHCGCVPRWTQFSVSLNLRQPLPTTVTRGVLRLDSGVTNFKWFMNVYIGIKAWPCNMCKQHLAGKIPKHSTCAYQSSDSKFC